MASTWSLRQMARDGRGTPVARGEEALDDALDALRSAHAGRRALQETLRAGSRASAIRRRGVKRRERSSSAEPALKPRHGSPKLEVAGSTPVRRLRECKPDLAPTSGFGYGAGKLRPVKHAQYRASRPPLCGTSAVPFRTRSRRLRGSGCSGIAFGAGFSQPAADRRAPVRPDAEAMLDGAFSEGSQDPTGRLRGSVDIQVAYGFGNPRDLVNHG
jgi:hypothetical protein